MINPVLLTVWASFTLPALVFLGRVIAVERHNPKTMLTYGGVWLLGVISLFPLLGVVVVLFCVIEFPQHFKTINRPIYKRTEDR